MDKSSKANMVSAKANRAIKKPDVILIVILLAIFAILGLGYYLRHQVPAIRAEVTVDGKQTAILDLSKNQEITVDGARNGTNHLIVQDGQIWCSEASCPDKVCIRQGKQSKDGDIIVCLPNLMIVQIVGD